MKKLEIKEIEKINGGLKCAYVGILAVASLGSGGIGFHFIKDDVVRCWNS